MNYNKKYKCIIVEDEPIAAENIENFILQDKDFQIVGKCADAVYASSLLSIYDVDLMFLDLNLPVLKGFDFLKKLKNPPLVIVTTAYHEFALESYELGVVDYLLKPIPFKRFLSAVAKFKQLMQVKSAVSELEDKNFIYISIGRKQVKIYLHDIFYIESLREYIKIHTKLETFTVKMPISRIEEILDKNLFIRIHKSYIVSKSKIEIKSANELVVHGKKLPVGRTYKQYINNA